MSNPTESDDAKQAEADDRDLIPIDEDGMLNDRQKPSSSADREERHNQPR